jgi:hypothetical protein
MATLKGTMASIAGSGGSLFLRKGLVTAQVALSFLLLFGAGLFVRSLQNLKTTDTGVALDNLVSFQLAPALSGLRRRAAQVFYTTAARAAPRDPVWSPSALASCRSCRERVGQLRRGRRPQGGRRRGHAGVHERRVAGLLCDDEDFAAGGPRLPRGRCQEYQSRQRIRTRSTSRS